MEPEKTKNIRLVSLDGLRGFAILLVFLTHINAKPIIESLPPFLHVYVESIFSSGVTGVSLLFILCGFLMAYLYPQPASTIGFLQRRYTRIFPLFLSMATAMAIIRLNPAMNPFVRIGVILGIAVFGNLVWSSIQKMQNSSISRGLFYGFIALQIIVGCWYAFYIMRKPPVVFNSLMPKVVHDATVWLVNSTLTLPLGNYIPMLDGVYWSLAAEVLFYILYPILFVPIIVSLSKYSKLQQVIFLVFLIPFIISIDRLSHLLFGLSMLQFPLFYYFVTGIVLAIIFRHQKKYQDLLSNNKLYSIFKILSIPLFIIVLFLVRLNLHTVSAQLNPWLRILWALPLTFFVFLAIDSSTNISKIFSSKTLIYLGKISYSLYLSHTATVEIMKEVYTPKTAVETIIFISVSFIAAVIIASILQYLLERPYFMAKREKSSAVHNHVYNTRILFLSAVSLLVISIFIAYQSQFNFFSSEYMYGNEIILSPSSIGTSSIDMNIYRKVALKFQAHENNLGILTLHPQYYQLPKKVNEKDNWQTLRIRIKEEKSSVWYASADYSPVQIGDSQMLPFGFPVIVDAKGKSYIVELELLNLKSNNSILLKTTPVLMTAVSQMDKKYLIKHPTKLVSHISRRVMNVALHREAQITTASALPALVFLGIVVF